MTVRTHTCRKTWAKFHLGATRDAKPPESQCEPIRCEDIHLRNHRRRRDREGIARNLDRTDVHADTDGAKESCVNNVAPLTSHVPRGSLKTVAVVLGKIHLGKASEGRGTESQYGPTPSNLQYQPSTFHCRKSLTIWSIQARTPSILCLVEDVSGTHVGVRGYQAPHPETHQPGGRGGKSQVLTRVSLCQNQSIPSAVFSPTQTTLMPSGGFQIVWRVRRYQK